MGKNIRGGFRVHSLHTKATTTLGDAAGRKRGLPKTRGASRGFRCSSHSLEQQQHSSYNFLSPWHFLSPWLSDTSTSTNHDMNVNTAEAKENNQKSEQQSSPSSLWETTTLRLINSELGTLHHSHQWHEAERALCWWTKTRNSAGRKNSHRSDDDRQAVEWAFQLLDRLCDEAAALAENQDLGAWSGGIVDLLTYENISLAIHKWRTVVKKQNRRYNHDEMEELSPEYILQLVDTCAELSPYFRPDAPVFNMILDAMAKWPYEDEALSTQLHDMFHHMITQHRVAPNSITYTNAIHALVSNSYNSTHHRDARASKNALALFQEMKKKAKMDSASYIHGERDHGGDPRIRPTQSAFGSIIGMLARSVRHESNTHDKVKKAHHAQDLLREMKEDWNLSPTTLIYSQVLHAWAQTGVPGSGEQAQSLLDHMLEQYYHLKNCHEARHKERAPLSKTAASRQMQQQENLIESEDESSNCKPNNYCFSAVMTAHAKNGNVAKVQELLQQVQHLYEESHNDRGGIHDPDMVPNAFCFNALIEAWANHDGNGSKDNGSRSCAQQAESILEQMMAYARTTGRDECLPNLVSFNLLLHAYAKESPANMNPTKNAKRALSILKQMHRMGLAPDNISFNCVLECLAKCSSTHSSSSRSQKQWAAAMAEHLVAKEIPSPDVMSYRNLIRAVDSAERSETILKSMCQSLPTETEQGDKVSVLPDRACFNAAITQWSRSQSRQAGQRAEALWRSMKLEHNIDPDVVTCNALMECWKSVAARGQPEAADRALSILRHMQEHHHQGNEKQSWRSKSTLTPNSISYTTCIWAFAAAKQPEKAEQLFRELEEASLKDSAIEPNLISYCALISAWAKVRKPWKAQAIFDALVSRSSPHAKGSKRHQDKPLSLRPNTAVYSALLHAWATAGEVERSVAILQQMCNEYAANENDSAMPDERCFSAVIGALSKSKLPDAAPQAEDCLSKMQEMADNGLTQVRPNTYTYVGVISCWSNSELPIAAERAEELLERLKHLYYVEGDTCCRPNVVAYTNTLRAWSRIARQNKSNGGYTSAHLAVERSERLLMEMLQSDLPDLKPNHITYGTILRTIADSRLPDKGERADRIVRLMEEHEVPLDTFSREQLRRANI